MVSLDRVVAECGGCRCKLAAPHDMAMLSYLPIFCTLAHDWTVSCFISADHALVGMHLPLSELLMSPA